MLVSKRSDTWKDNYLRQLLTKFLWFENRIKSSVFFFKFNTHLLCKIFLVLSFLAIVGTGSGLRNCIFANQVNHPGMPLA